MTVKRHTLCAKLDELVLVNRTFSVTMETEMVYLGGVGSFFSPLYSDCPLPRYFIGCFSNITINLRVIDVLRPGNIGIGAGCCVAPRSSLWCLDTTRSNLTLSFSPEEQSATDLFLLLSFSLQVRSSDNGFILLSHSLNSTWSLQLFQGRLKLTANHSGDSHTVYCPSLLPSSSNWHQVELILGSSNISCSLDGMVEGVSTFPSEVPTSLSPGQLQVGSTADGPGLVACIRRLRMDGADIGLGSIVSGEEAVGPADVDWSGLSLNTTELVVAEGTTERLSSGIHIRFPHDPFADELTSRYVAELENALQFEVFHQPRYGHVFIGHPPAQVNRFQYRNLLTTNPSELVAYSHNSTANNTDAILLRVLVGCTNIQHFLNLLVYVEERDSSLRVTNSSSLSLAVGTQKVVAPDVITVEDPESEANSLILFSVHWVSLLESECSLCPLSECESSCQQEAGGLLLRNGVSTMFFQQEHINNGEIAFQHFERYSTAAMVIRLGATNNHGDTLDVAIHVAPFQGHIHLISTPTSTCIFVREESMALVEPKHLNAVTDFAAQDPVLTYNVLAAPSYGVLQLYQTSTSEWLNIATNTSHASPFSEAPPTSFTQADVNSGHVRYVQTEPFSFHHQERFGFHLHSYNLSGPENHSCINIIPNAFAPQPSIIVDSADLVLQEGSSAHVNHSVLNTTLQEVEILPPGTDHVEINVHQLGIVYTLVESPSYGDLELGGQILVANDVFTYSHVTSNALVYVHHGTEDHNDSFSFYAEASSVAYLPIRAPNRTSNLTLDVDITPVNNHSPVLQSLQSIQPPESCWVRVTASNINVTDADRPSDPLRIYLRKKGSTPTGWFARYTDRDQPIQQFFMQDILDGSIIFVHRLNLTAPLNYTQVLRIDDGGPHTIRQPIVIAAIPLSLNISLPPAHTQCFGTIDADQQTMQLHFSSVEFSASLCDHLGENSNLVPKIGVAIVTPPQHGHILREDDLSSNSTSSNSTSIHRFSFRDLRRMVYVLKESARNESSDVLVLEFSYGHSTAVLLTLRVCILPVLAPLHLQLSTLVVTGGMAHITTEELAVTSSREEEKDSLVFNIVRSPRYGSIINIHSDLHSLTSFTHADITRHSIVYEQHTSSSTPAQDDVLLQVCSMLQDLAPFCLPESLLSITVNHTSLVVQNSTIHMREGGEYKFQRSDINVSAPPGYEIHLAPKEPNFGELYLKLGSHRESVTVLNLVDINRLHYNNTIMEKLLDSVEFVVYAERADPQTEDGPQREAERPRFLLRIEIEPVNNHPPELNHRPNHRPTLRVVQGGSTLISSSLLSAHDSDAGSHDDDLKWTLKLLPKQGYLFLATEPNSSITTWFERDIRNDRLYYHNNVQEEDRDAFFVDVSDGEKDAGTLVYVTIVVVNIQPVFSPQPTFSLKEGGSKRITYQFLKYFAENDITLSDSDFRITLTSSPIHGTLSLDGERLFAMSRFAQNAINSSQLLYTHDHSNSLLDGFTFNVSVPTRHRSSQQQSFSIKISAVDDDPPVAVLPERFFVVELDRVEINSSIISIEDLDSRSTQAIDGIVCQLVQPLIQGRLEKERFGYHFNHTENFTKYDLQEGKVWYRQLGLPDLRPDALVFNITDGINKQSIIYNLTIIVLPRMVSLRLSPLAVTENKVAMITEEEIAVTHPYLSTLRGIIALEEGSGPRHGTLVNNRDTGSNIRSFSTEDISNGSITYIHNSDEEEQDSFRFVYKAIEPSSYNRWSEVQTFSIDITLVNDEPPIIHSPNTNLKLWYTDKVILSEEFFNITDYDTPPHLLRITFEIHTIGGHVAFASNPEVSITTFTQEDVLNNRTYFVHEGSPNGMIVYNVTDGVHTRSSTISIYADWLYLDCLMGRWEPVQVDFLGRVRLAPSNLFCTTSDEPEREIFYYPQGMEQVGHFDVASETNRSVFSSTEIADGLVTFVHTETGIWIPQVALNVTVRSHPASPETVPLHLHVQYPHPPTGSTLAINSGLSVAEGGSALLNETTLDARNLRYAAWMALQSHADLLSPHQLQIHYDVHVPPEHGDLTISGSAVSRFTQAQLASSTLHYTHDDSETVSDAMVFNVSVACRNGTVLSHNLERFNISVSPVNDQPPTLQTLPLSKSLVLNCVKNLSAVDLEVVDGDSSPGEVSVVILSVPDNTQLLLRGSVLTANDTFTQQDINQHRISLNPFAVGVSSFTFTFSDGRVSSQALEFVLTVEKHFLRSTMNSEVITSFQNETSGIVLTNSHLDTSTNGQRSQTLYTVLRGPCCGQLILHSSQAQNFTQEDIDNLRVVYVPEANTHNDSFYLNITNSDSSLSVNMSIHIMVLGHTNEVVAMEFAPDSYQLVLPPGLMQLDQLKRVTASVPLIRLLAEPRYGHLQMQVPVVSVGKRSTSNGIDQFRYDDLQRGWIVYVWDYSQPVLEDTVTDAFPVLVTANGVLPGEATITVTLVPPASPPSPSSTSTTSTTTALFNSQAQPTAPPTGGSGFPIYTLVPIVGIILFLLLLILIVVVFCLTQQKKIKKKWAPTLSQLQQRHSPWSASSPPIPMQVPHYDCDPSGMPVPETENHNSDTSSGFSEPDNSPRHTPIPCVSHSPHPLCSSPSYHPPRSRMRSNVSITFSSRCSESEMSVEPDTFLHSSLSHYPPPTAAAPLPLPVRPASHTAFNRPFPPLDSGITSLNSCTVNRQEEENSADNGADTPAAKTDSMATAEWAEGKLPDFNDPNIQRLFHAHNPVLKKEEYWL